MAEFDDDPTRLLMEEISFEDEYYGSINHGQGEDRSTGEGCTNPDDLKRFLLDSEVDNESEKHLEENCISLGLKFSNSTSMSFFKAVSSQLRFLSPEKMPPKKLKKAVVDHLLQNRNSQHYEEVFGTAEQLKSDIVIVTSSPNSNPEKIVTWIVGEPNFSGDPLLLGHCKNQYWSLEPIQKSKIRNITTKQRVCEMRSNAKRASACTNTGDLERFLCDGPVIKESKMRLRQNCSSVGLICGTETERTGDCFFKAVSAQLNRLMLQEGRSPEEITAKTPEELRQDVIAFLSKKYKSSSGCTEIEEFLSESFESWCAKMKDEGEFADYLVVVATAQMLEIDIVVVTSSSNNSNPHQNVTWIIGKSDFSGEPLLLGHYWLNYYQSLEPLKKIKYTPKPTIERVTEMRKFAIKDFTCTCHEEILLKKYQPGDLKKGDHIMRPVKKCLLRYIWFHHAIFKSNAGSDKRQLHDQKYAQKSETEQTNGSTKIKFKSIGFTPEENTNGNKSTVCPNAEELDLKKEDLYKVEYHYPKNTNETVLTEIKSLQLNSTKYHLCFNNCEHVCRSCVTGESTSLQADLCNYYFQTICFGCCPRFGRLILVLLAIISDFMKYNENIAKWHAYLAVVDSIATFFYLALIIRDWCKSKFRYKSKMMCPKCYCKQKLKSIASLFFFILAFSGVFVYWFQEYGLMKVKYLELGLGCASLICWLILELYLVCSERCRRNVAHCLCFCSSCCSCCSFCDCTLPSCCDCLCKCECCQNCVITCFEYLESHCNCVS